MSCHIRGLFEDSIVPEALASLCHSSTASSLWLTPLTDTIGHTGSQKKNPRFQSHHCCEGNCSCLSCKSAPPLYKQRHIFTHCHENMRAHTHTHRDKKKKRGGGGGGQNTQRILSSLCQSQSRLLLSCFLYSSLPARGCWLYSDRIHLMFSMCTGLTVFIGELKAHHAISSQSRLDRNSSADHLGEL